MTVIEVAPPPFLSRAHAELEVAKGDGRTVFGIAVPFDRAAEVNDGWGPYTETFKRGAFDKWLRNNKGRTVKLMVNHQLRRFPIGRATELHEEAAGLYGEFRVSQTVEGDDALTLVRDGVVDAFSVGFEGVKDRTNADGVVERTEVILREVSLVAFPAYEDALVAGVRNQLNISDEELAQVIRLLRSHPDLLGRLAAEVSASRSSEAHDEGTSEPAEAVRTATTVPVAVESPRQTGTVTLEELREAREQMGRRMRLLPQERKRYSECPMN